MIISLFYHVSLIKIYNYIKIDHVNQNHNIMIMITLWFSSVTLLVCTFPIQYHIQNASGPYSGWLIRFRWLFYYFVMFYWSKYIELCQSLIWWSKSKFYNYDQIDILLIEIYRIMFPQEKLKTRSTIEIYLCIYLNINDQLLLLLFELCQSLMIWWSKSKYYKILLRFKWIF